MRLGVLACTKGRGCSSVAPLRAAFDASRRARLLAGSRVRFMPVAKSISYSGRPGMAPLAAQHASASTPTYTLPPP